MSMPSQLDLAWCAGFLDGEGCFHLHRERATSLISPVVKANQAAHREPIDSLQRILGGTVRVRSVLTATDKMVYEWQIRSSDDLKRSLPLIIPYMRVKDRQALLILELAQYVGRYGRGGNPYRAEREDVYDRYLLEKGKS